MPSTSKTFFALFTNFHTQFSSALNLNSPNNVLSPTSNPEPETSQNPISPSQSQDFSTPTSHLPKDTPAQNPQNIVTQPDLENDDGWFSLPTGVVDYLPSLEAWPVHFLVLKCVC